MVADIEEPGKLDASEVHARRPNAGEVLTSKRVDNSMFQAAQTKEKQEWAVEKPKLDNVRQLRGICFVDPEDGEYKETIKNARKKLEVPMEAAMPCKMETRWRARKPQETVASESTDSRKKTNYTCIVEAHESTR